ncbi:hypothetical protein NECAME_09621 [Necator americanus]|uniref:Exoribonuclease phosphorolytic domain-containing protein n=1 Tax=Necator americanus TaxID=51031 RepID=W2TDA4_NECAM|nr:hypothetical protein NECAME_09621 [Necator americanus]ETN79788.1 hypothetical protein NECAME_09621 [Necator americanus]
MARFASGAVVASAGDSSVLSTCVFRGTVGEFQPGQDFLPLLVDFKQSAAAVGKIPTNYLRRELGQTDADILASRVIDRSLRPLFPESWRNETQLLLNPTRSLMRQSRLDMLLTGCGDRRTVMIEMDGDQVPTERLEAAVDEGLNAVDKVIAAMDELQRQSGKEKTALSKLRFPQELENEVRALCEERLYYILSDPTHDKISRDEAIKYITRTSMTICAYNARTLASEAAIEDLMM